MYKAFCHVPNGSKQAVNHLCGELCDRARRTSPGLLKGTDPMRKIANTSELQSELRRLLAYAQSERPSRRRIASALEDLSLRLAKVTPSETIGWKEVKDGVWLARAKYADGATHSFGIYEDGDTFGVEVDTPDGTYQRKKPFDSFEKARKYAAKFIDKANGNAMLADVLDKDFKPVQGRPHVSPLN